MASRKVGLRRADAAIDAMLAYGFPKPLIGRKLKELLNVYGEEGWTFVEEGSYRVLLEAILEELEKTRRIEALYSGGADDRGKRAESMSGGEEPISSCSPAQSATIASVLDDAAYNAEDAPETITRACAAPAGKKGGNFVVSSNQSSETDVCIGSNAVSTTADLGQPVKAGKSCRKHGAYHGWITTNDITEEDLIELTPQPLGSEIERLLLEGKKKAQTKRKRG